MSSPDSTAIPPELAANVARGNCVLFLGADYPLGEAGPPTRVQLANALAERYDWVTPEQELRFAAEEYLSRPPADYQGLRAFVIDQISACTAPGDLHRALADLGFSVIVSNTFDDLLETALKDAGRRVLQVVETLDFPYASSGEAAVIVRLAGTVSRPDSLVLTDEEQIEVENRLAEKLEVVRSWCLLWPLLFIGWDPDDASLRRLYKAATVNLGRHQKRNYIVWPDPSSRARGFWTRNNVEIISAEPLPFVRALQQAVRPRRPRRKLPREQPIHIRGKLPYKFLDYFDPEDHDIFCGRDVEAERLFHQVLRYPLVTLFGQSGVGKTSLLRAGLVPRLRDEGYQDVYVRALGDPLRAIREGVSGTWGVAYDVGDTLRDFFQQMLRSEERLVVILDQLEELFIRSSPPTRKQFWRELSACLGLTTPEVRFVLALREDFLAELFVNVLINAAQAMPDGGTLTVSTRAYSAGPPFPPTLGGQEGVEIAIADTGFGIPAGHLDRIFDPFFTAWPAGSGTGLGLWVSQNIVHEHGGTLEVQSKEGDETTFIIKLPFVVSYVAPAE